MIVLSKYFCRSLARSGIDFQEWDNIEIKISSRLIRFHQEHDARIISKAFIHIHGDNTKPNLLLHLVCKLNGIELFKIEPCFDFQKQVDTELHFKPCSHRKRRRCRDGEIRQLFLAIFR